MIRVAGAPLPRTVSMLLSQSQSTESDALTENRPSRQRIAASRASSALRRQSVVDRQSEAFIKGHPVILLTASMTRSLAITLQAPLARGEGCLVKGRPHSIDPEHGDDYDLRVGDGVVRAEEAEVVAIREDLARRARASWGI
jgi:hypothetical protein